MLLLPRGRWLLIIHETLVNRILVSWRIRRSLHVNSICLVVQHLDVSERRQTSSGAIGLLELLLLTWLLPLETLLVIKVLR